MKHYYAFKVLVLNSLSVFTKKVIGLNNAPGWLLDWFIDRYIYNLTELAKRLEDNESLQKVELVRYLHENKKEK